MPMVIKKKEKKMNNHLDIELKKYQLYMFINVNPAIFDS